MVRHARWLGILAGIAVVGCLGFAGARPLSAGRARYPDLRGSWLGTLRYAADGREESLWLNVVDQVPPAPGSRSARFFGGVLSEGVFAVDSMVDGGGRCGDGHVPNYTPSAGRCRVS